MDDETDVDPQSADPEATEGNGERAAASDEHLRARVQAQRRHITGLTGKDPLRGGIDD
jgi:hypothetical protein